MSITDIQNAIQSIVLHATICAGIKNYHIATNALLIDKNSEEILIKKIKQLPYIQDVQVINRYINMKFDTDILNEWQHDLNIGKSKTFNIEYCSPNPTGPLHLGHLRNTLYGAAIARLYRYVKYNVVTDMYINNAGNQFDQFVCTIKHYHNSNKYPEVYYKGEYVKEYAASLPDDFEPMQLCRLLVQKFQKLLKRLGIIHDRVIYETDQEHNTDKAIEILKAKGMVIKGRMKNQKTDGEVLMVANLKGCDEFVLARSDGRYTYAAYDIGYSYGKYLEGFSNQICSVGEDHIGHIKKMNTIMCKVNENIDLNVIYTSIVKFKVGDELLKMSKRQGDFITIESILNTTNSDFLSKNILTSILNALLQTIFQYSEKTPIEIDTNQINDHQIYVVKYIRDQLKMNKEQTYVDSKLIQYIMLWSSVINHAHMKNSIHAVYSNILDLCKYIHENELYKYSLPIQIQQIIEDGCEIIGIV